MRIRDGSIRPIRDLRDYMPPTVIGVSVIFVRFQFQFHQPGLQTISPYDGGQSVQKFAEQRPNQVNDEC